MALKNYTAKITLKSVVGIQDNRIQAKNQPAAKRLIEAQFAGQIKSWLSSPKEIK
jgi:hypothetical protein